MHATGQGVTKDELKATQLFRKACNGGDMQGCTALGLMYASGLGVAKASLRYAL